MPIINVSQSDLDRSKAPEQGWHLAEIMKIEESPSKKKDSINTKVEFVVKKSAPGVGESTGRFFFTFFNSKGNPAQWLDLFSAVLGKPRKALEEEVASGGLQLDTDTLLHKQVWADVQPDIVEGKIYMKPVNYASDSNPPF